MPDLKLTIFVSSPGDVHDERARAATVIDRLQREVRNHAQLEAYFWEDEPLQATGDFQAQIVLPSATDVAVFILWARLGTRLPPSLTRPDGSTYSSGTEFEFEDAFNSHQVRGTPDLLVYRKTARAVAELDDEGKVRQMLEQKKALDAFCNHWLGSADDSFKAAFHTFQTLEEFERRLEIHLRKLIRETVAKRTGARADEEILWPEAKGSPYRGLEPFELKHAPVFYGRGQAIDEIVSALQNQAAAGCAFVLIFGMSGCGKSSVARAGVLPRLTQPGVVPEVGLWRRCVFRPSDAAGDLFGGLAQALFAETAVPELKVDGYGANDLADALRDGPGHAIGRLRLALHRAAEAVHGQAGLDRPFEPRLVLVVDQLEELFTLERVGEGERSGFIDALSALARSGLVWVLATMRSDFYPRCAEIRELDALKKGRGQYDLLPPTFAEVGQMIRLPARDAGLHFEQDAATKQWLDDLLHEAAAKDAESLPLLEFTLERLYQTRTSDHMLTLGSYRDLGGLEGALAQHAEDEFTALPLPVQAALPSLLPALVTVAQGEKDLATSRRVPLEVLATSPERRALVDALIRARLLVADRTDDGQAVVGFVHEALLRHWTRLRDWIEADRDFLRVRTRVVDASARWRQEGRSTDFFLPEGKPLAEARDLLAKRRVDLDPDAVEFVEASLKHRRQKRRRRTRLAVALATSFVVVSSIFGAYSFLQRQRAESALVAETRARAAALSDFLRAERARIAERKARTEAQDNFELASQAVEQVLRVADNTLAPIPGREQQRRALAGEALKFCVALLGDRPSDPGLRYMTARVERLVGNTNRGTGRFERARVVHLSAVVRLSALVQEFPGETKYRDRLAELEAEVCETLRMAGRAPLAEPHARNGLVVAEALWAGDRNRLEFLATKTLCLYTLAEVQLASGKPGDAVRSFDSAADLLESLAKTDHLPRSTIPLELAMVFFERGDALRDDDRAEAAERSIRQSIAVADKLLAADVPFKNDVRNVRSGAQLALARTLASAPGRSGEAALAFDEAVNGFSGLTKEFPWLADYRKSLALALEGRAALRGATREADDDLGRARTLVDRLVAESRDAPAYDGLLGLVLGRLGLLARDRGNLAEARKLLQDAITHQKKALALNANPDSPPDKAALQRHEKSLKGLGEPKAAGGP
jgi:tetratricopeptide (TPR) repeat protein